MSISLLEKLAGKTEEFEVDYNGMKIVFRTLSQKEFDEILAQNPRTDLAGLELNKVPVLARAIVSVDGQKIEGYSELEEQDNQLTDTQKKERIFSKMDAIVVNELFNLYGDGREKIVKKKIQQTKSN